METSTYLGAEMKKILIVLSLLVAALSACSGDGSGGGGGSTYKATSGVAQKGPLQLGSLVTAQELDSQLSPTGKEHTYQIDSDLGTFSPTSTFTSQYLSLNATGNYYDEVTNAVSGGTLTINGIADMGSDTKLNVNLLTALAYKRIKNLVTIQNMTVAAARTQAEGEVLAALNIHSGSSFGNFGSLDISGGTDGDNMLAAISSIFVYGNSAGDLSFLISSFQNNIATSGTITISAINTALTTAAQNLNPASVAANISAKYALSGAALTTTNISDWIDQDGDGVIGKFVGQVSNASSASTYTFLPTSVVALLANKADYSLLKNGTIARAIIPALLKVSNQPPCLSGSTKRRNLCSLPFFERRRSAIISALRGF